MFFVAYLPTYRDGILPNSKLVVETQNPFGLLIPQSLVGMVPEKGKAVLREIDESKPTLEN